MTTGNEGVGVGDTFELVGRGLPVKFTVAEIRDACPGEVSNQAFVVASRDQLRALRGGGGLRLLDGAM